MIDFVKLQRILGIQFHNVSLLEEALTHKSYAAEHQITYDNQRLELLGDAVVQIILTRYLYDLYPDLQEGSLTKVRAALVNQDSLACLARKISLGDYLRLGKGELELHGGDRDSTICDAMEAFTAAVYLDQGLEFTTDFFLNLIREYFPDPKNLLCDQNPKGALQEYTQQKGIGIPTYKVVGVSGPDHEPVYTVELSIQEKPVCQASSSSRKHAEREAARLALIQLKQESESEKTEETK